MVYLNVLDTPILDGDDSCTGLNRLCSISDLHGSGCGRQSDCQNTEGAPPTIVTAILLLRPLRMVRT
jgi:hypothetical protein